MIRYTAAIKFPVIPDYIPTVVSGYPVDATDPLNPIVKFGLYWKMFSLTQTGSNAPVIRSAYKNYGDPYTGFTFSYLSNGQYTFPNVFYLPSPGSAAFFNYQIFGVLNPGVGSSHAWAVERHIRIRELSTTVGVLETSLKEDFSTFDDDVFSQITIMLLQPNFTYAATI